MVSRKATYRDSGVDIDAGNEAVRRMGRWVKETHGPQVLTDIAGGFGGFFSLKGSDLQDPVLVGATDGVGTKLKIAFLAERFDTVGIDLVAMSVNDLIVGGARPLFFFDYLATGTVSPEDVEQIVKGIAAGCLQSDCALLGGETAEMPGFYRAGEFDLAGTAVGIVERKRILDGRKVKVGDAVIGLASSGLHSNGFSLVRNVLLPRGGKRALQRHVDDLGRTLGEELLEPTRVYVKPIMALLDHYKNRSPVRAMAHITGGGLLENVPRVLPKGCGVVLQRKSWTVPPIFDLLRKEGDIARKEMDRVFNQGLGMVVVVAADRADAAVKVLHAAGETASIVGEVVAGRGVKFGR
ncbi:MAG: phosphoribosylformylglycinamidine cyclo-ligase [Planctomycetota bacterium]